MAKIYHFPSIYGNPSTTYARSRLNREHPLCPKLWYFDFTGPDLVRGLPNAPSTTVVRSSKQGVVAYWNTTFSGNTWDVTGPVPTADVNNSTLFIKFKASTTHSAHNDLFRTSGSNTGHLNFQYGSAVSLRHDNGWTTDLGNHHNDQYWNLWHLVFSGNDRLLYKNGDLQSTTTANGSASGWTVDELAHDLVGEILYTGMDDRAWTSAEVKDHNRHEFCYFDASVPEWYFKADAAAGGLSIPIAAYHYNHSLKK